MTDNTSETNNFDYSPVYRMVAMLSVTVSFLYGTHLGAGDREERINNYLIKAQVTASQILDRDIHIRDSLMTRLNAYSEAKKGGMKNGKYEIQIDSTKEKHTQISLEQNLAHDSIEYNHIKRQLSEDSLKLENILYAQKLVEQCPH